MATSGGYSFERTILETVELTELKNTDYTDLELAALVGETLRKGINCQEEEIAHLKSLIEERNQQLKKEKKCSLTFASLEAMYDQPMNRLDSELVFERRRNAECWTKMQKYNTLLERSTADQRILSQMMRDLTSTKNDQVSIESSDDCMLCSWIHEKQTFCYRERDENHTLLVDIMKLQVQLEKELKNAVGDRKGIQEKIDLLNRQLEFISETIMTVEQENLKLMFGGDYDFDKECQTSINSSHLKERVKSQNSVYSPSCCTGDRCDKFNLFEKPPGRFVSLVQSLMTEKSSLSFPAQ